MLQLGGAKLVQVIQGRHCCGTDTLGGLVGSGDWSAGVAFTLASELLIRAVTDGLASLSRARCKTSDTESGP